jgi:competence protein ComEA
VRIVLVIVAAVAAIGIAVFRPAAPAAPTPSSAWSTVPPRAVGRQRTAPARAVVYVAGEVAHPGVYALGADARVGDALARAGGARPDADLVAVNLAAHLRDGDEIVVAVRGAPPPARAHRTSAPRARAIGRRAATARRDAAPPAVIDVNSADAAAIAALPGVGPVLAERIVAFRDANGRFDAPDELLDVDGVTESRYEKIAPYVIAR